MFVCPIWVATIVLALVSIWDTVSYVYKSQCRKHFFKWWVNTFIYAGTLQFNSDTLPILSEQQGVTQVAAKKHPCTQKSTWVEFHWQQMLFFPAIWCIKSEWEHFEHCWWPLAHSGKLLTLKVWKTCIVLFMEIYTHIEVLLQFWEDHLYSYLFARLHLPDLPRRRVPCGLKCNLLGEWKMTDISCWRLKKNESSNHRLAWSGPGPEQLWLEKVAVLCMRKKTVLKLWQ